MLNEGKRRKIAEYVILRMKRAQVGFKRLSKGTLICPERHCLLLRLDICTVCCVADLGTAASQDGRGARAGKMLRGKRSGPKLLPVHLW